MEEKRVPDHRPVRREDQAVGEAAVPVMPVPAQNTLWPGAAPYLLPASGRRYTLGWQNTKKTGPSFVLVRSSVIGPKVVDRYPLSEDGWAQAWAALLKLDVHATETVAENLKKLRATEAKKRVEKERRAHVFQAIDSGAAPIVFRWLGVQVLAQDSAVYTIGTHDTNTKTNTSQILGSLAGAQAMITDGAQAWSPGRAMFLPIALAGLATKTKADAAVIFPDGAVHTVPLDGNYAVREAQKQVVKFNAIAAAAAPVAANAADEPAVRLRKLLDLLDAGLLTQEEYQKKREGIIDSI